MRVAFISHNRCGLNLGGLQRQIVKTKEGLEGLGHDVLLWDAWQGVRPGEYDVAHFFTADHTLLPVHEAFAERGIPTVLSPVLGAGMLTRRKQQLRRDLALSRLPIYQDLSRVVALVRQADLVVALHEKEQALCEFYGRTGTIVCIPNGVSEVFSRGRAVNGQRLADTRDYYIHVGQFWPNKGQRWLIENWDGFDADLVLVGERPSGHDQYHTACREAARGRRVRFMGGFPPDSQDLADLYAGARALVLNSESEVAPIVVNEAFASGTAVVMPEHLVSDRERVPEATFRHGDPQSFRRALSSLESPQTRGPSVTWTDVAHRLVDVYGAVRR